MILSNLLKMFTGSEDSKSAYKKKLNRLYNYQSISDILPYDSFDDKRDIYLNKDSIGFIFECDLMVGSGELVQRELSVLFDNVLPAGSNLQFFLISSHKVGDITAEWLSARQQHRNELIKYLADSRSNYLNENLGTQQLIRNQRLIVSYSQKISAKTKGIATVFDELYELKSQIQNNFMIIGLRPRAMRPEGLINLINEILCFESKPFPATNKYNKSSSISSQIAGSENSYFIADEHIVVNKNNHIEVYKTEDYPEYWSLSSMGKMLGDFDNDQYKIVSPFILFFGVHKPKDNMLVSKKLAKASKVEKSARTVIAKWVPQIVDEANEWGQIRQRLKEGDKILYSKTQLILFGPEDLVKKSQIIIDTYYYRLGWKFVKDYGLQLTSLIASLPMSYGEFGGEWNQYLGHFKTSLSSEVTNLLPMQGECKGTNSPGMILSGRRGQLMYWYPFDSKNGNYNVCVVGRSGAGKSVFMEELVTAHMGLGGNVFILDCGRSFEKLTKILLGKFIEFSAGSQVCLNPFSTIDSADQEDLQNNIQMIKSVIVTMAGPNHGTTDLENALIEQAVIMAIANKGQASGLEDIYQILINSDDSRARDVGTKLFPYSLEGQYGRYFNGQATLNFNESLITVEFEELNSRKDLQSVIVQMYMILISNRVFFGKGKTKTIITIDEAWQLLEGKQSGQFIEAFVRKVRKYNAALVVGTQSMEDFEKTASTRAVLAQSDTLCLLSQKIESIEVLKKEGKFKISDHEAKLLESVRTIHGKYAEVMIKGAHGFNICRLYLDDFSKTLYSTADEYHKVMNLVNDHGLEMGQAVKMVSEEKYAISA